MADRYAITGQQEVIDLGPQGPVRSMQITFRTTDSDVTGTVTVPLADYSAERVKQKIEEYVMKIDEVHQL